MVNVFKSSSFRSDQPDLFKVSADQPYVNLHLKLTALRLGFSFVSLSLVEGKEIQAQQEAIQQKQFREITPIYRLIVCL